MNLVYVAPHAVEYTKRSAGFVPVALCGPGYKALEGEIGNNGRDRFILLQPGVYTLDANFPPPTVAVREGEWT